MEAVPRLPMISCDIKISPSNTEFGHILKKFIRDHYHEDPESYNKEIKELETLRQNAIKAPMDFTGCSMLKRYYSQLHKLQSRFPMTDDGPACVPFMWTDIYSGVAYNITDIEYEEACILYNIGALHSKLGTLDSRCNAEGMKIACTHFQCAAWAFQHLRDTYPQPKGSDMSHDLLTFFINIMLAQAQECILEKSMLDSRKSSITAKIAAQVVDYYKCALGIMVSGSPSTDTGSVLDIVGSKVFKGWKKFIEFKMSYYTSISHLYMGNQAEENEKWGERVAWFQSAHDQLNDAFKIAKNIDRDDLNEPLTFTMDVIGGKHNSSKKENEFVYHDKVPALGSLPDLKGASLVKGIPFSITDPDVSGPDIFARLVPMEAHETSSLYSEEKAKLLRSMASKIEEKNEELMAYLSSLQLESAMSFQHEERIPEELLEKCAAVSVGPDPVTLIRQLTIDLIHVSDDVDNALKSIATILQEEEKKELEHQENFGKRGPSLIIMELKKKFSKLEEAHKKAIESNNTLESAVNVHITHLRQLHLPLDELADLLPSIESIKTPENVKNMDEFSHLVNKVDEMRKQREYLEQLLRDALLSDDITKSLVTMKKKEDLQHVFAEELKKHADTVNYLDQNLTAQDKILCALTEANARYAETRKAMTKIQSQRNDMVNALISSFETYGDLVSKVKKGIDFYQKLHTDVTRLLTRIRSVTNVQDEERAQMASADLRKAQRNPNLPPEPYIPKLKDYLPYMTNRGAAGALAALPPQQPHAPHTAPPAQFVQEPMRQPTMGGPAHAEFNRKLKPQFSDQPRPEDINAEVPSMGPTSIGSEQTSMPAMGNAAMSNAQIGEFPHPGSQRWTQHPSASSPVAPHSNSHGASYVPYQYPSSAQIPPMSSPSTAPTGVSSANVTYSQLRFSGHDASMPTQNFSGEQFNSRMSYHQPASSHQPTARFGAGSTANSVPASMAQVNGTYAHMPQASNGVPQISGATSGGMAAFGAPDAPRTAAMPYPRDPAAGNSSYLPPTSRFDQSPIQNLGGAPTSNAAAFPPVHGHMQQPSWQGGVQMNHYTPISSYNQQTSVNDQKAVQDPNTYHSAVPPVQYYQSNAQPPAANVTAPMDTRTSTFSTAQNFPGSNQNFSYSSQPGSVSYSMNSNNSFAFTGTVGMQPQYYSHASAPNYMNPSMQAKYSNANSGMTTGGQMYGNVMPGSSQNNMSSGPINPNQSGYYTYAPQGTHVPSNSVPAAVNNQAPNAVVSHQGSVPVSMSSANGFISQQNYQPPNVQTSYAMTNMAYNSNLAAFQAPPVPSQPVQPATLNMSQNVNQPFQATAGANSTVPCQSLQPNLSNVAQNGSQPFQAAVGTNPSVACPPLQPIPSSIQANQELSPAPNLQHPGFQNPHLNSIRDLITPPLEKEPAKSDVVEKEPPPVLQPQVIDINNIAKMVEKEPGKDPLDDPSVQAKFVSEVEKYEKFVEGLVRKSLNGTLPLDQKWKELIDVQDKESRKLSISVARCYPLKNRFPDVMPYDSNRVQLASAKDDYINASYLKDICPSSPVFVITQSPLPSTFADFWLMVWEQQVETLICLLPDCELKNHVYFPKERGPVLPFGAFETTLHSYKEKNGFVERMINVTHIKNRTSRVVVHLQFTQWPVSGIPQSPAPLLLFISDVLSYHKQQRSLMRPVVVHCSAGIGRSGCFCLITALVNEMNGGHGPRDVAQVATTVSQQRKFLVQDKEQLKFCYDTVLYYAQDLLMKRGILVTRASFDNKLPASGTTSSHVRHPSEDFILGNGGLAKLQSGVEKMGLSHNPQAVDPDGPQEPASNGSPCNAGSGDVGVESPQQLDGPEPEKQAEEDESVAANEHPPPKDCKVPLVEKCVPSITSLLDPSNFTLDGAGSPGKRKITKESFISSRGSLSNSSSDSADPLSQLDPLWSLKKQ